MTFRSASCPWHTAANDAEKRPHGPQRSHRQEVWESLRGDRSGAQSTAWEGTTVLRYEEGEAVLIGVEGGV